MLRGLQLGRRRAFFGFICFWFLFVLRLNLFFRHDLFFSQNESQVFYIVRMMINKKPSKTTRWKCRPFFPLLKSYINPKYRSDCSGVQKKVKIWPSSTRLIIVQATGPVMKPTEAHFYFKNTTLRKKWRLTFRIGTSLLKYIEINLV